MPASHSGDQPAHVVVRVIDRARYDRMANVVAPVDALSDGFLGGDPVDNRTCRVIGGDALTYRAFFILGGSLGSAFVEAVEPMTVPEWRQLSDVIFEIVA